MNKLINYTQIENETLKDSIDDFLSILRGKSPAYFSSVKVTTVLHSEFAEVFFQLNSQVMMEDMAEELAEKLGVHILYAVKYDNGKIYKAVAYSVPVENRMYIVFLDSQQYGIMDSLTVYFYDSMDDMYKQVCKEYTNRPKTSVFVLEKEAYSKMLGSFI